MKTTTENTVIATRTSFDGAIVELWSDGAIGIQTDRFHSKIVARQLPRSLAFVVLDDVCLYDASEVKTLVKAARKAHDMHRREPHRVRECDLRQVMRAYAI